MAFKMTMRFLIKTKIFKSELILRNLPQIESTSALCSAYLQSMQDLKVESNTSEALELLTFPYRSFQKFHKSELKNIIDESFNKLKITSLFKFHSFQKMIDKLENVNIYNNVIQSYIDYNIDFNINIILKEMKNKKIKFNQNTYCHIISYYCKLGDMDYVENIFQHMKSDKKQFTTQNVLDIITGYIISRQYDKSKAFIKEFNLDENNENIMVAEAIGYATIGDVENVLNLLDKITQNESKILPKNLFTIYSILIKSQLSESNLKEVFQYIEISIRDNKRKLFDLISNLNRNEFHKNSANLVNRFIDHIDRDQAFHILTSFSVSSCPSNIYEQVLRRLISLIDVHWFSNVFTTMDFDEALRFSRENFNNKKARSMISVSIINKSISDKSLNSIQNALKLILKNRDKAELNFTLQYTFIRSMCESELASNCEEILNILPNFKPDLLPVILMHKLTQAEFHEFNKFADSDRDLHNIPFVTNWSCVAFDILKKFSFEQINEIIQHANKVFSKTSINSLVSHIVVGRIKDSIKNENLDDVMETVLLAENLEVTFTPVLLNQLQQIDSNHSELYKCLYSRYSVVSDPNQ